jgi:hypothetical protein
MRLYALAAIFAAAALFSPVPASSQGIEIGPGGVHIDPGRDREGLRGIVKNCGGRASTRMS